MQMRPQVQLASMIKAMKDVVIPALDSKNDLAVQQAQLVVGLLNLMAHQLPLQFQFDRDELRRLIASARALSQLHSSDPAIEAAARQLVARSAQAASVLERCGLDPEALTAAVRDLREATGMLATAAESGADPAALHAVETAILDLSKQQLLRDRSLMLPQGWEPDPTAVPAIETLLHGDR
jgi:hypothetical protein